jgi:hypothetical protein
MALPQAVTIDFSGLRSKAAMLEAIARALKFPRHFGMNLDALHDCLTDLEFPAGGCTITLAGLARTAAGEAVYEVVRSAARFWKKQGHTVTVVRQ